jgi:hypothetical protein
MKNTNTIEGSWYVVELDQKAKEQPKVALVMDLGRGLFIDHKGEFSPKAKKSLENIPEIKDLGEVKNQRFIYEKPVNYWRPLSERSLMETDSETVEGVGNLSINDRFHTIQRRITPAVTKEVLNADPRKPYCASANLYVVRYRNSLDKNINPFHQTAIIARNEADLLQFKQERFSNWFNEGYRSLAEIANESGLHLLENIVIMPEIISDFQREYQSNRERD